MCVRHSDAIASLGMAHELANYGEYSGAPNEEQTYEYSKTILSLMTREHRPDGKVRVCAHLFLCVIVRACLRVFVSFSLSLSQCVSRGCAVASGLTV
jgi:succinyl-CoA synthetase beta subunit